MEAPILRHHHHAATTTAAASDDDGDSHLIPIPPSLVLSSESFLKAAISLKNQVVEATWRRGSERCEDPTVYTGMTGTAFACLRAYEVTGDERDLVTASEIVLWSREALKNRGVTFLCGRTGVYALGAVIASYMKDDRNLSSFLDLFFEVAKERALPAGPEEGGFGMSYDLLNGRAGFLWSAIFLNKRLGGNTIPVDLLASVVEAVMAGGRAGASDNVNCPLMYRWHGTRYWGAAHGLAGILNVLLHFQLRGEDRDDVKLTLRYMMANRFASTGNYPSCEGNARDSLVQWSHGAGGVAITLCKAAQVFPGDRDFYHAAVEAGELVWKKGLLGKVGLSDGTAGNAYTFLSLYRLTGEEVQLERAKSFASFLFYNADKLRSNGEDRVRVKHDHVHSLYEGLAGLACLWFDLVAPENSRFPGFEM